MPFDDITIPTIRFVCLSDLHMKESGHDEFNVSKILNSLIKDIVNFNPHFLFFTGDISFSGKLAQYQNVKDKLFDQLINKRCHINIDNIFTCPGNHDLDRATLKSFDTKKAKLIKSQNELTDFLSNDENQNMLLLPHAAFIDFSSRYGAKYESKQMRIPGSKLYEINLKNRSILIAALSSSYFSSLRLDLSSDIDEPDYGHLAIGEYQIFSLLSESPKYEKDLCIVITHHPLSYLHHWDRDYIESYFQNFFDMHLYGHCHLFKGDTFIRQSGQMFAYQNPALFSDYYDDCAYSLITWYLDDNKINIVQRGLDKRELIWKNISSDLEIHIKKGQDKEVSTIKLPLKIEKYKLHFEEEFNNQIIILGFSREDILEMVQSTFSGHIHYFRQNYEHLPIPIANQLYCIISKSNEKISFHSLIECSDRNLEKISDWNNIIMNYRKLTYLSYRQKDNFSLLNNFLVKNACKLHDELRQSIKDYFDKWYNSGKKENELENYSFYRRLIDLHMTNSKQNCDYALHYMRYRRDYAPDEANKNIVMGLELSLNYIHKIILSYYPGKFIAKDLTIAAETPLDGYS